MKLPAYQARSVKDLKSRLDNLVFLTIPCASCERSWKVARTHEDVPGIRLMAMPPDDLPAGSCPSCSKTWCIGCAKTNLDNSGRFVCTICGKPLKLINEGLKKIIYEWASASGISRETVKRKRGRPRKKI